MNKKIFLFFIILPLTIFAQDKRLEFAIRCEVLDSVVLIVKEGKSERYSFYNDGYRIGDFIDLNFRTSIYDPPTGYWIQIFDSGKTLPVINFDLERMDFQFHMGDMLSFRSSTGDAVLSKNVISLNTFGGSFVLERYYKDDWHGYLTDARDNSSQTMTLNCKGISNKYNMLLEEFEIFHSK